MGDVQNISEFDETATLQLQEELNRPEFHKGTIIDNWDVVREALLAKADPDIRSSNGETVMHDAARTGNIAIMELVLECGGNINAMDSNYQSPLRNASGKAALWLIERGADVNIPDCRGNTRLYKIIQEACLLDKLNVSHEYYPEITALAAAGASDERSRVRLSENPFVKAAYDKGFTEFLDKLNAASPYRSVMR